MWIKYYFLGRFRDDGFVIYDGIKEEIVVGFFLDISNNCYKYL